MSRDPYRYFRVEARELQELLGKSVLELDKGIAAPQVLASLLRLAHTLKGAARVVKQREIADQAHAIEEAMAPYRDGGSVVSRAAIDAALRALDAISQCLAVLNAPAVAAPADNVIRPAAPEAPAAVRDIDDLDALLKGLAAASAQLAVLRRGATTLRQGHALATALELHARPHHAAAALDDSRPDKVAALRAELGRAHRQVNDGIEQLAREVGDVRECAERMRLAPASRMFLVLERAARDAAVNLGKQIEFVSHGGAERLDAQVFGAMQGALLQMVRNAVAHGIETPASRTAAGKHPTGRVGIRVQRRGHQIGFTCHDDGRGVDLDAVRSAAVRKGLPAADAARLDKPQLLQLLLKGGLSTSGEITQLAGRGIGLDLVRDTVTRLHGTIDIRTTPGIGTDIELAMPVSLAAVDALVVVAGGRTVGIPLEAVKHTLRVAPGDLMSSPQGASICHEGQAIPFAPLERILKAGTLRRQPGRTWSTLLIEGAGALAAVGVDHLQGMQNLVVRPLPALTPCDSVVEGASLDAAGQPQLLLQPEALVACIAQASLGLQDAAPERMPILVVDDSLTTRMLEQSILESAGYEVDLAVSGEDGLQRARSRRYALYLVDVEMPGMDGFTFIERTLSDPQMRDTPAVLVTSLASAAHRQRGREAGARGHIVKGEFDQSELLRTIRSLVSA
jgi:two-component system, chemotaxis family, sensor kinase CheA